MCSSISACVAQTPGANAIPCHMVNARRLAMRTLIISGAIPCHMVNARRLAMRTLIISGGIAEAPRATTQHQQPQPILA